MNSLGSCLFWPFVAFWKLLVGILTLTGRLIGVILGFVLMIVGLVMIVTVILVPVGIPLLAFGSLLVIRSMFQDIYIPGGRVSQENEFLNSDISEQQPQQFWLRFWGRGKFMFFGEAFIIYRVESFSSGSFLPMENTGNLPATYSINY